LQGSLGFDTPVQVLREANGCLPLFHHYLLYVFLVCYLAILYRNFCPLSSLTWAVLVANYAVVKVHVVHR
jgi:hypothetical protein